jgi:hypothetical protein
MMIMKNFFHRFRQGDRLIKKKRSPNLRDLLEKKPATNQN